MSPDDRNPSGATDEPFFARWARRKAETNAAEPTSVDRADAQTSPDHGAETDVDDAHDSAELDADALAELPDPDTLEPGDDFSVFMKSGVPSALRNRALRKLWLSNPALANLDELVDYGEDFTDSATVIENLQTAYRVGRGFFTDEELEARDRPKSETHEADSDDEVQTVTGLDTDSETAEDLADQSSQTVELCAAQNDGPPHSVPTVASEMTENSARLSELGNRPKTATVDAEPPLQARAPRVRFVLDEG